MKHMLGIILLLTGLIAAYAMACVRDEQQLFRTAQEWRKTRPYAIPLGKLKHLLKCGKEQIESL